MRPIFLLLFFALISSHAPTVYKSLDKKSLRQLFAFYELYPDTNEGKQALKEGLDLLKITKNSSLPHLDSRFLNALIKLDPNISLDETSLKFVNDLSFPNRNLKGSKAKSQEELQKLSFEEIDLGRAIFLLTLDISKIPTYEAILDLMALQVLLDLPQNPTDEDKIFAINDLLFHKMGFRFPPESLYPKEIDHYTFLSSVLDTRKGVCLGVSILYFALSQRLNLHLNAITPPGHIYLSYEKAGVLRNIETTARGVDFPDEMYLGLNNELKKRNAKELIGLALVNQASIFLKTKNYEKAHQLYENALLFLPNDWNTKELYAMTCLFIGEEKKAKELFIEIKNQAKDPFSPIEDFLDNRIDKEGLKNLFYFVDETRESILEKQKNLKKTVKSFPKFRDGLFQLASTYLQLGRTKEALFYLEKQLPLDPKNVDLHYYLASIYYQRHQYTKAWTLLLKCQDLLKEKKSKPLLALMQELEKKCPKAFLFSKDQINSTPNEAL